MTILTRDEITRLSPGERLALIGDLWGSPTDSELDMSAAQQHELTRRLASFDEDKARAVTWENLKAEFGARAS
jgi:putative addiction module component (TIGR02574 family)